MKKLLFFFGPLIILGFLQIVIGMRGYLYHTSVYLRDGSIGSPLDSILVGMCLIVVGVSFFFKT